MHLASKLDQLEKRFDELTQQMADPAIISDADQYRKITKAQSEISDIVAKYREWKKVEDRLSQARPMLHDPDPDLKSMAEMEIMELEPKKAQVEEELKVLLLPKDPNDDKNVVLEIRAGTGGDEAIHQVSHINMAEAALRRADLRHPSASHRADRLVDVSIARPIDHGRAHDDGSVAERRVAHGFLGRQLRPAVMRDGARFVRLGERPIGGAGTGGRQATHVDQPANISKMAGGAQQGGGGEGIAAMVVGRGAGLGYAGQVDDGVHTAQRFRESGAAFEVAMRQFDGGGQVRGRTSHQASQGTALRHKTFDQMATDEKNGRAHV